MKRILISAATTAFALTLAQPLLVLASAAVAQEKFIGSNVDQRTTLTFKASDAAVQKMLPLKLTALEEVPSIRLRSKGIAAYKGPRCQMLSSVEKL